MNDQDDPLLLDHEADGIRELDNLLPRWWVWLFYATILFSVIYLFHYHVLGTGDLMAAEYEKESRQGEAIKAVSIGKFEANLATLEPSKDAVVLATGKASFTIRCAPCHRLDGGGLVGPNLCDDYWIHGSNFTDNVKTIWNGVKEKGMLAWKEQGMKPGDVVEVASYIYTLRGTRPPNPKPREDQTPVPTGPSIYE